MKDDRTAAQSSSAYRFDRLRIRHIRLLEVIQRCGSLGAAAREFGLSQPAVTLMLRELEDVFGATLVDRDVRGATISTAGLHALERLRGAMASVEHAIDAARAGIREPLLRLGCSQVAGISALPLALARMEADSSVPPIQIREGEAIGLLSELFAGELDCVVAWMDESVSTKHPLDLFDITPLWYGRMQVVASVRHPLARVRSVGLPALNAASWVLPRPGSRTFAAYTKLFVHNGYAAPPVTVECASIHTGIHIAGATNMLTIAPDTVAEHYAGQGLVSVLKGDALDLGQTHVSIITMKDGNGLSGVIRLRRALLDTTGQGPAQTRKPASARAPR